MTRNGNHFDWKGLAFVTKFAVGIGLFLVFVNAASSGAIISTLDTSRAEIRETASTVSGTMISFAHSQTAQISSAVSDLRAHIRTQVASTFMASATSSGEQDIKEKDEDRRSPRVISTLSIEDAVPETGRFIGVDLQEMELYLYEDGEQRGTYEVLSKGRPGSQWETPSGQYDIIYKNTNHLSSIGDVYMPYSMQFYGNFFIHGWPYYADGTPVDEGFSGGCIRLSTTDAEQVFAFTDINTPVFVSDTEYTLSSHESEFVIPTIQAPRTSAESYLVADLESGEVFAEKNSDVIYPIASISKLMTAVVANETIAYNNPILVTQHAVDTEGWRGELKVGERLYLNELLYPLLLDSSNDAATAIADHLGYQHFLSLMNKKAEAIGMSNTSFGDPSGLSPHNISTSNDLFELARYIHERKGFLFSLTTQLQRTFPTADGGERVFSNRNPFSEREDFLGGKNGYTDEARKTLLSLFNVPVGDEERTLIVIVLQSENHDGDSLALLDWFKKTMNTSLTLAE